MNKQNQAFIASVANMFKRFGFKRDVRIFIACQFALESDFGRSRIANKYNNYCGMKVPLLRLTTAVNTENTTANPFAIYSSLSECILDYVLWIAYNKGGQKLLDNVSRFSEFLKDKGYCPAPDYTDRIMSIYVQYQSTLVK